MIKQLSLFGEEPVEAPKKAPVEVVETTKPKPYRLVPPTNIIEDLSDTKNKRDASKKGNKLNIESVESSSMKELNKPTTDADKLKAISMDLFADILPEPVTSSTPETKESTLELKEEELLVVVVESVQEEMMENIIIPTPEFTNEATITQIQQLAVESILEVTELEVEQPLHPIEQESKQEIEVADISIDIQEPEQVVAKGQRGKQSTDKIQPEVLLINIMDDEILFSKQYYPISEVAAMFNVKVSLLRFWENEFDILKPRKNRKGDRLFRPEDVKNIKLIYFLLKEKKYTIEGARIFIKKGKNVKEKFAAIESLKKIKGMLMELKASLSS